MFEVEPTTIAKLYKTRWTIKPFFKKLKQNFVDIPVQSEPPVPGESEPLIPAQSEPL